MKKSIIVLSLFCFSYANGQLQQSINWKAKLHAQDLIFDNLSEKWDEGAFLGNGLLGVMVYREDSNGLRFDLGRTDVVDHKEGINPSIGRARLPIGRFVLRTTTAIDRVKMRLDLWNAELSGTIYTGRDSLQLQALVPASRDVIIINIEAASTKHYSWEWKPEKAISPFLTLGRDSAAKYPANPPAQQVSENNIHYHEQHLLAGGSFTTAWKEAGQGKRSMLLVTVAKSYPPEADSKSKAKNILNGISPGQVPALITTHRNYWHQFYKKSSISIPDRRLESFWWIQQYKMASATRTGAYPIDLMGPWFYKTPWPKYWWNLNIQLTYYPFFSSNHIELVQPLLKMINDHVDNLAKNTPAQYQHNSAALARSGPYDMRSPIRVVKGNDSTGSAASMELGNLTWLLHVYWQAYEHTLDRKIATDLYPVLKRAINYYLHIAEKGDDGKYHLPYTYSPEYPRGITRDANYDLSLFKWGLQTLLFVNRQFSLNDTLVTRWNEALQNLTPYPQDEKGYRIGRDADFSISHRHYSHLLQVYPLYEINWDQPQNRDIIVRSLNQWKKNDAAWRGYSYTGSGSIYAMMGEGDSTLRMLNEMMDKGRFAIRPNTMYLEAGPVIETPLSAVTTINEMLLQSWGGVMRVFPAVPSAWDTVSFMDLRAKGAFLVSAERTNGTTRFIRIRSLAGAPCVVRTGFDTPVKTHGKRAFRVSTKNGDTTIDLKKGEEVILYTGAKPAVFQFKSADKPSNQLHWGLPQKSVGKSN